VTLEPGPPLVGRELELRTIAENRAAGGVGFVVAGPSGVGKTRLARAALAAAEEAGAAPLWVQATRSAATIPLGALAGVLPEQVGSEDPLTVLRTSARALTELAGRRQLVLGVDDAQHLDQTSAALLLHLARASAAFIVVTLRTGEPCPDAIPALWKDAGAERLALGALDEADTDRLLEGVVGGPVEGSVREWIWQLSHGNALYVTELVRGLLSEGALTLRDGLWRMSGRPRVPTSLTELVSARVAGLGEDVRRSLELLALGEPLRLSELTRLESLDSLVVAEAEKLITVDETMTDPVLCLAHPLYGEAIRAALPALRARQVRLRLAESLRGDVALTPESSLRVARWLLEAGEPIPHALLVGAARSAIATGDPELGGLFAGRAIDAGGGIEAQLLLARSLGRRNRFEEAAAALVGAEELIDTQDVAITYVQLQTSVLYWGLNRVEEVRAMLARASTWWPDGDWQGRLEPLLELIGAQLPPDDASGGTRQTSILFDATGSDPQQQRALQTAQLRRVMHEGRGREAYRLALALRPAVPFRDVYDQGAAALWVGMGVQMGEGWDEVERWCVDTMRAAVRHDDHSAAGVAALGLGSIRYAQGRFREAARWLAEAELHYERYDPLGLLVIARASQSAVACAVGDADAARAALERCQAAVRSEPPPPNQLPHLRWAEAWTAVAQGESARGWRILLDGAAELTSSPLDAALLGYDALRTGAPAATVAPLLASLDARTEAPLITAAAVHAAGVLEGNGTVLLDAADKLEMIGALRYACEAAAHAAHSFLAEGQEGSARRAAAHSRRLFVDGEGGRLPSIDGLAGPAAVLSAREAELAALAAQGLSNAEIADRLVLSVRSVETYLYRAMHKLGLTDRRDLAGAIGSSPRERRIAS
jgi:DNA-binding CsgD family transcriptional regulator/tetratricopeptide (TPR) repeat protein